MTELEQLKQEIDRLKAVNEIQQVMAHYEAVHLNPAYIARSIECFADWRDDISADVSDWGCFFAYDVHYPEGEYEKLFHINYPENV